LALPFRTLAKAQEILQNIPRAGITVYIRAGTYAGISFSSADSGVGANNGVTWTSYNGEAVTISVSRCVIEIDCGLMIS
jgi:hypothetical protein